MSTTCHNNIRATNPGNFDPADVKSINKGRYILIAMGVIVLIGSLVAAGCLYSHLGYTSFSIGASGGIVCILNFLLSKYCCKNTRIPHSDGSQHQETKEQSVQHIDINQKSIFAAATSGVTKEVPDATASLSAISQNCAANHSKTNLLPALPKDIIQNGYGEYLIYRIAPNGKKEAITDIEYEKIFNIIEEVRALKGDLIPQNRHNYLKTKIQKELDQNVFISFIPRTIYELMYLRECIQEDVDKQFCCNACESGIANALQEKTPDNEKQKIINSALEKGFWQQCLFEDKDYEAQFAQKNQFDYRIPHIQKIAARLNYVALEEFKKCCSHNEGFTYEEIQQIQSELLTFFKELHNSQSELHEKASKVFEWTYPGIARQFAEEKIRDNGCVKRYPQGIANERHEKIIHNAIQLECSNEAAKGMVLYRGSELAKDDVTRQDFESWPASTCANSLSYGSSLFAGALYDGGASAFHYMRENYLDAQALIVPLKKILSAKAVFHAFYVHPLIQLMSRGEIFHPRTKVWELNSEEKILGFLGLAKINYAKVKICCRTSLSKEGMEKKFSKYKNKVYLLA
jgi:hypothetical protein